MVRYQTLSSSKILYEINTYLFRIKHSANSRSTFIGFAVFAQKIFTHIEGLRLSGV